MIQTERQQGVGVGEDAVVYRQLLPRLIDALIDRDMMSGHLTGEGLKSQSGQMEKLQSSGDPLQEHLGREFVRLVIGPEDSANFRDRRKAIVHLGDIAI